MLLLASIANPFPRPSPGRPGKLNFPSPSQAPWPQPTKDMISCRGVAKKRRRQEPAAGTVKCSGTVARTQQSLPGSNHVLRVLMGGYGAAPSRRETPELCSHTLPSKNRGRRESRVRAAPAVSRARCAQEHAHEHTGSAESIRPSLRNGFTAYSALSSATNSCCHRRLRIDGPAHPGWVLQNLRRLDISNGCQDHTPSPYAATFTTGLGQPSAACRSLGEGIEAPFVRAPVIRSQTKACPAIPFARPTLPRPPHPNPRS